MKQMATYDERIFGGGGGETLEEARSLLKCKVPDK